MSFLCFQSKGPNGGEGMATADSSKSTPSQSKRQTDRLDELEKEMKKMRKERECGSVQSALAEVRSLALKKTVDHDVLLARFENLVDVANHANDEDAEFYKIAYKSIKDSSGDIKSLITRLVGTATAKKVTTAVDQWKKANKGKPDTTESPSSPSSSPSVGPGQSWPPVFASPLVQSPSNFPPGWGFGPMGWSSPPRFPRRGGGRPGGRPRCFNCGDESHYIRNCPKAKNGKRE